MGYGTQQEFDTFTEDEIREIANEEIDTLCESAFPDSWEERIREIIADVMNNRKESGN